jgi:hypothetical protein
VTSQEDDTAALPFLTRLWFAWVCLIRVLFDSRFAARTWAVRAAPALPGPAVRPSLAPAAPAVSVGVPPVAVAPPAPERSPHALQLLSLFQREGRLVDFLEQDITSFSDEDVGAAARLVHQGCREALRRLTTVKPVRSETEGANVTLEAGFAVSEVKLIGDVKGAPPYRGTLRHRGWRAAGLHLPERAPGHDDSILAPAEVEL